MGWSCGDQPILGLVCVYLPPSRSLTRSCFLLSPTSLSITLHPEPSLRLRSIQPHAVPAGSSKSTFTISYNTSTSHFRVFLNDTLIREVNAFGAIPGHEVKPERVFLGVMGASPLGGGVEARFENFEMRNGVRAA
jgi:hypothetical protein